MTRNQRLQQIVSSRKYEEMKLSSCIVIIQTILHALADPLSLELCSFYPHPKRLRSTSHVSLLREHYRPTSQEYFALPRVLLPRHSIHYSGSVGTRKHFHEYILHSRHGAHNDRLGGSRVHAQVSTQGGTFASHEKF
jgi:hypothetical protein